MGLSQDEHIPLDTLPRRESDLSDFEDDIELESLGSEVLDLNPKRKGGFTFADSLGLVIGLQIGSGIFASPNQVHIYAGSYGASLIVWIVAGVLAATGAACYAELGSCLPRNGGTQAYLSYIYGPRPSFVFTVMCAVLMKPGAAAIIALVFGDYLCKALSIDSTLVVRVFSVVVLVAITAINSLGKILGAKAGTFFLVMKFSLIGLICGVGLWFGIAESHINLGSTFEGTKLSEMPLAIYGAIWAYDGWDNLNFVSAEMRHPTRDLPRTLGFAMPTVIICYVLTNIAYFVVLSPEQLDQAPSVSLTMMNVAFGSVQKPHLGKIFGIIVAIGVALSCAGALNATAISSAKLVQSAAQDKLIPGAFLGRDSARFGTPVAALWVEAGLTCVYIILGEFKALLAMYGAALYVFYLLTVIGLLVLRRREPNLERPYKAHIVMPITFAIVSTFLVVSTAVTKPVAAGLFIATVALILALRLALDRWWK